MYLNRSVKISCLTLFFLLNVILFYLGIINFNGNYYHFIILFLVCNFYIYYSFEYSNLFLDKTLSIFFWLGFFYKLCIILIYKHTFPEGGGAFEYKPDDYDKLIKFSYIGISAFLFGSIFFNKYFTFNSSNFLNEQKILVSFYQNNKKLIFLIFLILLIIVNSLNLYFGFYQKGLLPETELNFLFGAFIKWMLLFGLTSISCLLIEYEIKSQKYIGSLVIFLFLLELAFTNYSLLSRSLIFTGSAVLFSTFINFENYVIKKNINNSLIFNSFILFIVFAILIIPINKIRNTKFIDSEYILKKEVEKILENKNELKKYEVIVGNGKLTKDGILKIKKKMNFDQIKNKEVLNIYENIDRIIFVIKNRFVGLDGVAAVTSYPDKNFSLFILAIQENFNPNLYGFYERTFIKPFENNTNSSKYVKSSKRHYGIILPGIISFLSYSGSIYFLIISCFLVHLICSLIEHYSRKFTFNSLIFSNFIGFIIGYRLVHFGYLPKQSYLIISAIVLTILSIYITKKLIINFYKS
tara:strand:+ start:239 stop:1810 length:1572 start_codon:yes stop_codon:yes gene_type:complete